MKVLYTIVFTATATAFPLVAMAPQPQQRISTQTSPMILVNMAKLLAQQAAQGNEKGALALLEGYPAIALMDWRDALGRTALQYAHEKGLTDLANHIESIRAGRR